MVDLASRLRIFPLLMGGGICGETQISPIASRASAPVWKLLFMRRPTQNAADGFTGVPPFITAEVRPLTLERPQVGSHCALSHVRLSIIDCEMEMRP